METLNSILEVLQLNQTFFVYLVCFFVFLILVSKGLISPVYDRFLERESLTKGQILKAEDLKKENQILMEEYEQKVLEYNQKFQKALQEKKEKILQNQTMQVEKAHQQIQEWAEQSRSSFKNAVVEVRKQLDKTAPLLAKQLISKLMQ